MNNAIKTVIVDDNQDAILALENALFGHSDIVVRASVNKAEHAKEVLLKTRPDVVFLDVEMPGKTGFEVLEEVRPLVEKPFFTVFYSAYEKYTLQAIKESAFDYILKPVNDAELGECVSRIREKLKNEKLAGEQLKSSVHLKDIISLPTATGIRFTRSNQIIMICNEKEKGFSRNYWHVLLNDEEKIRLRTGITSSHILSTLKDYSFLQINQSSIVNLSYISNVEIKTKKCKLIPPYDKQKLVISRGCMSQIRDLFDDFSVMGGRL